ncbi:hypothetical protein Taro_016420 [Colocasia esculenta]|uniref:Uncharacterized protein n=1 Tax=Colocasia esculenta TaxID=4460 RepID=A0A843UNG9_COLES|nr:hypothetical protein [Colocasia esculenta]
MVRGARSGSSSGRRSSCGRGLFAASASGSSSIPPTVVAGSGEFIPPHPRVPGSGEFTPPPPRVPAASPSSVPPPLAVGSGECTPSPPTVAGTSVSAPPTFLAGASIVPEAEDVQSSIHASFGRGTVSISRTTTA